MPNDIQDWTNAVTVKTGTITISGGTVDIGNTPTVKVASGTVTVGSGTIDIGNTPTVKVASGSITVASGTIDVASIPAVTVTSGTIDIGNTPTVKVASGSITVASGTIDVASIPDVVVSSGTISVGNIPTVKVASGTLDIGTVTTVDQITTVAGAKTVEVINKATTVVQTGDGHDLLFTGVPTTTSGLAKIVVPTSKLLSTYGAIAVILALGTGAYSQCVEAYQTSTYSLRGIAATSTTRITGAGGQGGSQAVIPMSIDKTGGALTVIVRGGSGFGSTVTARVYGLTANPGVQVRSDGRAYPIGRFAAIGGVTTTTLIAAPTTPLRILLTSLIAYTAQSAGTLKFPSVQAHVGGSNQQILPVPGITTGAATATASIPPGGLLLDAGTAVTWTRATVQHAGIAAVYDLVV